MEETIAPFTSPASAAQIAKTKPLQLKAKKTLSTSGQQRRKKALSTGGNLIPFKPKLKALSTSGQQVKPPLLSTGGQQVEGEKPPRPHLPANVQADCEWRESTHKSGSSFTLWFRPYKVIDRKKKRLKSDYVFYISVEQWEKLKRFDEKGRKNHVQADFNFWWQANKAARITGTAT